MEKAKIGQIAFLIILLVSAVALLVTMLAWRSDESVGAPSGRYSSAAATSDGTPCAQIAIDTLEAGGTAADATIAGMFCSGVVNPHSMGVGGGFLLTYYSRDEGRAYTLNAREVAPSAAYRDMFQGDPNLSVEGALAVAVPGELRGYVALYERFGGGVPWADLIAPAISLCEEGHPVSWHLANALRSKSEKIIAEPTLSAFVSNVTGDVLQEGDILYLPDLALTLRTLQQEPDALYTGDLAAKIIQDLNDLGGIITLDDLTNYTIEWGEPIQVPLQSVPSATLYTVPPPGSGPVLAFMLNVLDEYAFDELSLSPEEEVLTHQRITETFKYAYALRTRLGDPKFEDVEELVANMTSEEYARSVREMILEDTTSQDPEYYGAYTEVAEDHGTSHFSVMAANGDSVAATSTVNSYLGAMISSTQTGVIYNNEMDDFSSPNITNQFDVPPSPINYIKPGKRPLSSMCPSVVVDTLTGAPRLVVGAAGGSKITSAVALVAAHNLWFGTSLEDAVAERRIHHQLYPMVLSYEEQFSQTIVEGLEAKNHTTEEFSEGGSVVGAVSLEQDGYIYAAADFRKSGEVDGY